jgi:hypothetical protein
VDNDTYALAYRGPDDDGFITTFTIPADGSSITEVATMEHDTSKSGYNSLVKLNSKTYALAYKGANNDGYFTLFEISANGATITKMASLEFEGYNAYNSLEIADANTAVLAYMGPGDDGYIKTFTLVSNDEQAPTILSVSLASDNSTLAVTFSEAIFNTDGGSGALEASDFAFSISGGTASLSSATPSSISASGNVYTLGIGLSGTPNESETLTVNPASSAIYDAAGNVAATSQSNNAAALNQRFIILAATKKHATGIGTHNSLVKVDDDTYVLAYSGAGDDGFITTFTISADGSSITEVAALEHDAD